MESNSACFFQKIKKNGNCELGKKIGGLVKAGRLRVSSGSIGQRRGGEVKDKEGFTFGIFSIWVREVIKAFKEF